MVEEEVDGGITDPGDAEHGGAGVDDVSPWPWWGGKGLFESDEFRFQGGEPGLELAGTALGVDCQLGSQVGNIAGPVAPRGWVDGGFVEGGEAVVAGEFGEVTVGEELLGGLGCGDVGDATVTPAGGGKSAVSEGGGLFESELVGPVIGDGGGVPAGVDGHDVCVGGLGQGGGYFVEGGAVLGGESTDDEGENHISVFRGEDFADLGECVETVNVDAEGWA